MKELYIRRGMPRPGRKAPRGKGCRAKGAHDFAGDEVTLAGEGM
ncbi:hypothetical protein [Novosphingobium sp.]|nr:hypothetical protein [Novosphingobium sp.]